MSFLGLEGRTILVAGVSNKKSVAFHVGQVLEGCGATVLYSVRSAERREQVAKWLPGRELLVCDVAVPTDIERLGHDIARRGALLHGFVHSIAHARYEGGWKPFDAVGRAEFLEAMDVSCYSLIAMSHALAPAFASDASVVAISISTTRMAAENYGYMAPIKAALDSSLAFLAKSMASRGEIRFNAVQASLLKTRSSAGIPGYADAYLYAEMATLRKRGLDTAEVANAVAFLVSPRSSGINAQGIVVDAGMSINYFDKDLVRRALRPE